MSKIVAVYESNDLDQTYFERREGGFLPFTTSGWTPECFSRLEFETTQYPGVEERLPADAIDVSDQYGHVITL